MYTIAACLCTYIIYYDCCIALGESCILDNIAAVYTQIANNNYGLYSK